MTALDDLARPTRFLDAEALGRLVREVWVQWASEQPDPKPSWLLPWEDLDEGQQEVDARMGLALFAEGRKSADCGCDAECDHPSYAQLASGGEHLGKVVDLYAEVIRSAIRAMRQQDAEAGMAVILDFADDIPELLEGLDAPSGEADTAGAAK